MGGQDGGARTKWSGCPPFESSAAPEFQNACTSRGCRDPARRALDRSKRPIGLSGLFGTCRVGGRPGFYLPWDTPELPVEVRREVFLRLSEQIGAQLAEQG